MAIRHCFYIHFEFRIKRILLIVEVLAFLMYQKRIVLSIAPNRKLVTYYQLETALKTQHDKHKYLYLCNLPFWTPSYQYETC